MKTDLQLAALQKLARLTGHGQLPAERRNDIRGRILKRCSDQRRLSNGVNGVTGTQDFTRVMSRTEYHSNLALAHLKLDEESVQSVLGTAIHALLASSEVKFALACCTNELEDPPSRQLSYAICKTLFRIAYDFPAFQLQVQKAFLDHMQRISNVVTAAIKQEDAKSLLSVILCLIGTCEAAVLSLRSSSPEFADQLIAIIRPLLDSQVLIGVESLLSSLTANESTRKLSSASARLDDMQLHYLLRIQTRLTAEGQPLGALAIQQQLLKLFEHVCYITCPSGNQIGFLPLENFKARFSVLKPTTITSIHEITTNQLESIEASADFLKFKISPHQDLSLNLKATTIRLACIAFIVAHDKSDHLLSLLKGILNDSTQMVHPDLSLAVLDAVAAISRNCHEHAADLNRALRNYIVHTHGPHDVVSERIVIAARRLTWCLNAISKDRVVSTLYSLVNVLSPPSATDRGAAPLRPRTALSLINVDYSNAASAISLSSKPEDQRQQIYSNVIEAIAEMVRTVEDEKIAELMISLLGQKFSRINENVDKSLVWGLARISTVVQEKDYKRILKLHAKARLDPVTGGDSMTETVMEAHQYMAKCTEETSPFREILLVEILNALVEVHAGHSEKYNAPNDLLVKYFHTLAIVLPEPRPDTLPIYADETVNAFRNMWFACVIHGVHPNSKWVRQNSTILQKVAANSPLLVLESATNDLDSDLELNPVLNRTSEGKQPSLRALEEELMKLFQSHSSAIRGCDYPKLVFLGAVTLVETLRSEGGRCSLVLDHFDNANLEKSDVNGVLKNVVDLCLQIFLDELRVKCFDPAMTALGQRELKELLIRCCDPVPTIQTLAQRCCDRLISTFPALLCHEGTTYVLLELLTLLWEGCLTQETDLYSPKFNFKSNLTGTEIELRDSSEERKRLLEAYHHNARKWLIVALQKSPDDMRMVLQSYLSELDESHYAAQHAPGRQLALEIGRSMPANDSKSLPLRNIGGLHIDLSSKFMADLAKRQRWRYAKNIIEGTSLLTDGPGIEPDFFPESKAKNNLMDLLISIDLRAQQGEEIPEKELYESFIWTGTHLYASREDEMFFIRKLVSIPFKIFRSKSMEFGISTWVWVSRARPSVHSRLFAEIVKNWEWALRHRKGLFNPRLNILNPFSRAMEYKPTDMQRRAKHERYIQEAFAPHLLILRYLRQHIQPCSAVDVDTVHSIYRLTMASLAATNDISKHPLAREARLHLVLLGFGLVREGRLSLKMQAALQLATYKFALSWYARSPNVTYGNNRIQLSTDFHLLSALSAALDHDPPGGEEIEVLKRLLSILLKEETFRVHTWLYPLTVDGSMAPVLIDEALWAAIVKLAWRADPYIAVHMRERFVSPTLQKEIRRLVFANPEDVIKSPEAAEILLGDCLSPDLKFQLKHLLYWTPVVPPIAISYFLESFGSNPLVLQYAMRSLLSHSVNVTFFYVPQIVQALRYDRLGYVEQFIMEASLLSPLFAHQIIWNMKANTYKDEDSTIPDPLKPKLDRLTQRMIDALSGEDKAFYEREFSFFNEVTSISGKLRPFIKRTKAEKKAKIDEEMKKIELDVGVYLPSNPDGEVIGIDRKSGRPLQSHAKAPFMATFKIRRVKRLMNGHDNMVNGDEETDMVTEVMQSAIFKVGDDCRQDVLALQLISAFRNIFNGVGLDLYLFPYRVTATAPGCGVIDVLPNSISRDMLGREHVNGLYEFFMREHNGPNSTKFQKARNNFITSMAAYSIVTYLLQFKDRHNGNIMIDSEGHILHIDFGFCFDIAPGGITFESAPFKLTHEMITVISGPEASKHSQHYRRFEELCVKGFLACRPYAEEIVRCVQLMLDSGLPCFKGMTTIKNLRDRFVLDKNEREASDYMMGLIRASHENIRTVMYDQFQYATNGIPY